MQFGEKIKAAREAAGMTQKKLAEAIGVSTRTIQLYEANDRQPKNATTIISLAHALGMETDYFLSTQELERIREQETFLSEATQKFGSRGKAQAQLILDQASALFAGGELAEEDQEAFFQTMSEIYFDAKSRAKKYTPKQFRDSADDESK
jgi:transcriptional regulator with XRE-family HTH domain